MIKRTSAIEKALQILQTFAPQNQEMGTSELSRKLGFHKATTSRILLTLVDHGFLQQDVKTRKFTLGQSIYELGTAISESLADIVQIAKPHVDNLRTVLDETIVLELWIGNSTVVAYSAENTRPLKLGSQVGSKLPFHVAAGAKAILSVTDAKLVNLDGEFIQYTPNTLSGPEGLKAQLRESRLRGFAVDMEELDVGICAVGMPIFNHENRATAAVVVVTPAQRFSLDPESKTILCLKDTVDSISRSFFNLNQRPTSALV